MKGPNIVLSVFFPVFHLQFKGILRQPINIIPSFLEKNKILSQTKEIILTFIDLGIRKPLGIYAVPPLEQV